MNEKNLIHGRVTAMISKFSAQIFKAYFSEPPQRWETLNKTMPGAGFFMLCPIDLDKLLIWISDSLKFEIKRYDKESTKPGLVNLFSYLYKKKNDPTQTDDWELKSLNFLETLTLRAPRGGGVENDPPLGFPL